MSVIATHPASQTAAIKTPTVSSSPSSTTNVDQIDTTTYQAVKWLVTVNDSVGVRVVAFEVFAAHRAGANPIHTIVNIIGDVTINYAVDVVIVGVNMILQVTNNEAVSLTINSTRTVVLI